MAAGWGTYGGAPKANPFAEEQPKFDNAAPAAQQGAWDIPLRDTDDQAPKQPGLTPPKPAAAPARSGWLGFGRGNSGASTTNPMRFANKEDELAWREEELRRREGELAKLTGRIKNWPPCWPWLYHDISAEIPSWNRNMVRFAYLGWLIGALAFILNVVTVLTLMFAKKGKIGVKDFFICAIATTIGLPMSFFGWYRNLYWAAQTDGSMFRYIKTLIWIFIHLAWVVIVGISFPYVGDFNAGFFTMLEVFDKSNVALGIMCIVNIGLWGISGFVAFATIGTAGAAMRAGSRPREEFEAKNLGSMRNIQLP